MDPGAALKNLLLADASVAKLVKKRVYAIIMPETTAWPVVTYQKISGVREAILTGRATSAAPRYQLNCWAKTHDVAVALAEAVESALDGYVGFADGAQLAVRCVGGQELFDETSGLYNAIVDVIVRHEVGAPV